MFFLPESSRLRICLNPPKKPEPQELFGGQKHLLFTEGICKTRVYCKEGNYGSDLLVRYSISRSSPIIIRYAIPKFW